MWQPISTAPKDGTSILGWDGFDMAVVSFEDGTWELDVIGFNATDGNWEPTHWMPVPTPPTSEP